MIASRFASRNMAPANKKKPFADGRLDALNVLFLPLIRALLGVREGGVWSVQTLGVVSQSQ